MMPMGENPDLPPSLIEELQRQAQTAALSQGWDAVLDMFNDV